MVRQFKLKILLAVIMLIYMGCSAVKKAEVQSYPSTTENIKGIWYGNLPCADCEYIEYQIELKNDYSFTERSVYSGKGTEPFSSTGKWSYLSPDKIELAGPAGGKKYQIADNELILLDNKEERIKSDFEKMYHLSRTKKNSNTIQEGTSKNPARSHDKFLKGIDFIATGNEPSWSLEMDFDRIIMFSTMDGLTLNTPAVKVVKAQDVDVTFYHAKIETGELRITVSGEKCQDSMSGEESGYKVRIEARSSSEESFRSYSGCGRYLFDYRLNDIWVMKEMTGVTLNIEKLMKELPVFEFHTSDMRFSGHAGCNTINGRIDLCGDKITFGRMVTTRMACPDMSVEKSVISSLEGNTFTYIIKDGILILENTSGIRMTFGKSD